MNSGTKTGKIYVTGIGPGIDDLMTLKSRDVLSSVDVIVGYDTYVDLVRHLLRPDQEVVSAGMTEEVLRAQKAVEMAASGKSVCVVSSGDAGIYGMAGLVYEVASRLDPKNPVDIEVVPGITALSSAASLLGSPIMHDFCAISLSDHLTPWTTIEERLHYAAAGDFVVALYNPKSSRRKDQIVRAREILLQYRDADNAVGIVASAYRPDQTIVMTDIDHMLDYPINMLTTVIIGNSTTRVLNGKMITPRGYEKKYKLDEHTQEIPKSQRMNQTNEPWSYKSTSGTDGTQEKAPGPRIRLQGQSGLTVRYYIRSVDSTQEVLSGSERALDLKFLEMLSPYFTHTSKIQTTSDGRLILTCSEIPREVLVAFKNEGIHLSRDEESIVLKKCNFCEGEKKESFPWLNKLEKMLSDQKVPGQINIGFNGCGMSCHGAVMEDIGIVYFRGDFEVYVGGRHMGRYVRLPLHFHKDLTGDDMLRVISNILDRYRVEGLPGEKFFKYILRIQEGAG